MRPRLLSLALASACAHYTPAPLQPAALADAYAGRRLDDPALRQFLAEHGANPADSGWRSTDLALVALYFQPALDRSRAAWRAARAAERDAKARPPASVQGELGRATSSQVFESRWIAGLNGIFTFELGGKRGARVAATRARTAVAEAELEETAWRTALAVRRAAIELHAAEERLADASAEQARVAAFGGGLRRRYAEGVIGRSEVNQIETEEATVAGLVRRERETVSADRIALAHAVGIPPEALEQQSIAPEPVPECAARSAADSLRTLALRRRPEIGRELAAYSVAEAELRVAVAGSYPDFSIGPAFAWDQGIPKWSLLPGLPRIPLDGNRGPIAEAIARRSEAGARFAEVQEATIAQVDLAAAACRVAGVELESADSVRAATLRRVEEGQAAYERGEVGVIDLATLELEATRALGELHLGRQRSAAAGLALEAATGAWPPGAVTWPDPREARPQTEASR